MKSLRDISVMADLQFAVARAALLIRCQRLQFVERCPETPAIGFFNPVLCNVISRRTARSHDGAFGLGTLNPRTHLEAKAVRWAGIGRRARLKQRGQQ